MYDADIGGWVLSDGIHTHTFAYGFRVAPGGRVVIHLGASGTDTATDQFAAAFGELPLVGSMTLLRGGVELVDFVQWGADGQMYEVEADAVGEWPQGDFVSTTTQGNSFHYDGTANDSGAWYEAPVSPGN